MINYRSVFVTFDGSSFFPSCWPQGQPLCIPSVYFLIFVSQGEIYGRRAVKVIAMSLLLPAPIFPCFHILLMEMLKPKC